MKVKNFEKLEAGDIVIITKGNRLARFVSHSKSTNRYGKARGYFTNLDTLRTVYKGARQIDHMVTNNRTIVLSGKDL